MPFLTDIDSRAKIKGSRDPLGFVPLWSRFGRAVVGNLTTVSSSVRGFTTLLLGYHFAREAQERGCKDTTLQLFLRFEQLAAYARKGVLGDEDFRGIERVAKTLDYGRGRVVLSAHTDHQILSNQRIYGLWGLFSAPARESGLLEQKDSLLTRAAEEFVQREYLPAFGAVGDKDGRKIIELISETRGVLEIQGRQAKLARALAERHTNRYTRREKEFYREHLVHGVVLDRTDGRQRRLADLLANLLKGASFDMGALIAVIKFARSRGAEWEDLADKLEAIRVLELLLVPADSAFGFVLSRHGHSISDVAKEVGDAWGSSGLSPINPSAIEGLRPTMAAAIGDAAAVRLVNIANCLSRGRYVETVQLLLEHNAAVMHARGGAAPWARSDRERLDVRFRDESGGLAAPEWLSCPWQNSYFLNSLHIVHETLAS